PRNIRALASHPKRLAKPQAFELSWRALCKYSDHWPLLRALGCYHTRPSYRAAEQRDELAAVHVWMAPPWQEITWRAAKEWLAVMCPACSRSPDGLLALMGSANRGLIIRAGSMSR